MFLPDIFYREATFLHLHTFVCGLLLVELLNEVLVDGLGNRGH